MKNFHWMILICFVFSLAFVACDSGSTGTVDDGDTDQQAELEQEADDPPADEEIPADEDLDDPAEQADEIETTEEVEENPAELEEQDFPEIDGNWEGLEWEDVPPCECFEVNTCCDGCWPINEGGSCDDGNADTLEDTCVNGVCVGCDPAAADVTSLASVGGSPTDLALKDNLLLASTWHGTGGFILNKENPTFPYAVGGFVLDPQPTDVSTFGIEVWNDYAFIMASYGGAYVFDISDPTAPTQVTRIRRTVEGSGAIPYSDVRIKDNIAYFAAGSLDCIDIWDLTQIDAASHLAQFLPGDDDPTCTVTDLVIEGNTLYAAGGNIGLLILDISNPSEPSKLGHFALQDPENPLDYFRSNGIELRDNLAYVTFGNEGLYILDVSNPANPIEKSHIDLDCNANTIRLRNDYAFVACRDTWDAGSMKIVNIADKENPSELRELMLSDSPWDMLMDDHNLYIADLEAGVKVYSISDLTMPTLQGMFSYPAFNDAIAVTGLDRIYTGGVNDWLWGVNMSWPEHPASIGNFNVDHDIHDIRAFGNNLFVASSGGLHWIEANPLFFEEKGYIHTDDNAHRMYFDAPYLYLAIANSGFEIYEFSGGFDSLPVKLSGVDIDGRVESVASNGQYLFVCNRTAGQLSSYDISDPENPIKTSETAANCDEVWTSADMAYVYVGSRTSGLQVFEFGGAGTGLSSSPVAEFSSFKARRLRYYGGLLYAVGGNQLSILDLSETPDHPVLLDTVDLGSADARDFARFGNTGFIACSDVGLLMIELDVCY